MVDSGSGAVMVTPLISSASQFTLDVSGRLVVSAGPASGYICEFLIIWFRIPSIG